MNSTTLRRLAVDHASLYKKDLPPYYLFPASSASSGMPDDLTQLTILLTGPQGTPYADGVWKLSLKIPQDYPKSPPKAFFKTKMWHPNVEESNGSVCLDTLKRDWQPRLTLRDILITISCLLINPNPDSALNSAAGKLLQEDWSSFTRHAKLMTSIHAKVPSSLKLAVLEASGRGEDMPPKSQEQAQVLIAEDGAESDDGEENSKENDPSLSPSIIEPPSVGAIHRPTVLGKRPLGDLPTPEEPPSDDEEDTSLTRSQRNIAANTPNLSSYIACMGLATSPSSSSSFPESSAQPRRSPKLVERTRSPNFTPALTAPQTFSTAEPSNANTIFCDESASQPVAKRVCSGEGKENAAEGEVQALSAQPKPAALMGLGVKALGGVQPALRKGSATSIGSNRAKPRVGMRRL